jgi:hypothetical protein
MNTHQKEKYRAMGQETDDKLCEAQQANSLLLKRKGKEHKSGPNTGESEIIVLPRVYTMRIIFLR